MSSKNTYDVDNQPAVFYPLLQKDDNNVQLKKYSNTTNESGEEEARFQVNDESRKAQAPADRYLFV